MALNRCEHAAIVPFLKPIGIDSPERHLPVGLAFVCGHDGRPADQIGDVLGHHRIQEVSVAAGRPRLSEVQQQATGQRRDRC